MKRQKLTSVQNRFTAYLVTAVANSRTRYLTNKKRMQYFEYIGLDRTEKEHTDFMDEFNQYVFTMLRKAVGNEEKLEKLLLLTGNEQMLLAIKRLKKKKNF